MKNNEVEEYFKGVSENFNLEDFLLWNPFESDRREIETTRAGFARDFFFGKVYVDMCFDERIALLTAKKESLLSDLPTEQSQRDLYGLMTIDEIEDSINRLLIDKTEAEKFKNSLRDQKQSLLFIRGSSGCGKTTFLNKLLYDINEPQPNNQGCHFIYDLNDSSDKGYLLSKAWICNDNRPHVRFITLLLLKLNELIAKRRDETESNYKKRLKTMLVEYSNIGLEEHQKAFEVIQKYISKNHLIRDSYNTFCSKFSEYIFKLCGSSSDITNDERKIICLQEGVFTTRIIQDLLELIVLLLICERKQKGHDAKYIIAFDGIENYIHICALQDEDIKTLIESIQSVISRFKGKVSDFGKNFRFILSARDTTMRIYPNYQQSAKIVNLDVSNFYDNFFKNRLALFNSYKSKDAISIAMDYILNDSTTSRHCSSKTLALMYSNNKRRLVDNLYQVLEVNTDFVSEYNEIWEKDDKDNNFSAARHLCRKGIQRLLLNLIKKQNYFTNIRVERQKDRQKISYARMMVNYLVRNGNDSTQEKLQNTSKKSDADDKYIPFHDFINEVFVKPIGNKQDNAKTIKILANILYHMSKPFRGNKWYPMILLTFPDARFNYNPDQERDCIEILENQLLKELESDSGKYGIRLTATGYFFNDILPEFEYFACRYAQNPNPLFSKRNLEKEGTEYRSILLIKDVKKSADECVTIIKSYDDTFYMDDIQNIPRYDLIPKNEKKLSHPYYIYRSHIDYLKLYKAYISSLKNNDNTGKIDYTDLIDKIDLEIDDYNKSLQNLPNHYKN